MNMSVSDIPAHINLKFIQIPHLLCSLGTAELQSPSVQMLYIIGFDSVTMGSLYFKCCFRLKRRNVSVQVFTAWQTALDSPCQSGLPNIACFRKGEYLLKGIRG